MTEEQLEFFSEQTHRAADKAVKRYAKRSLAGFLILLAGVGGALIQTARYSGEAREAIVKSGRAVAVAGCNRDFDTTKRLRAIFDRLSAANDAAHSAGRVPDSQYKQAADFYASEKARLKLPDCVEAENLITDENADNVPTINPRMDSSNAKP